MKKLFSRFFVTILTFAVAFSSAPLVSLAQEDNTLRVGLSAISGALDPGAGVGNAQIKIYYNVFDTLLFKDKNGEIQGRSAESWEWVDDTTVSVTLNEGLLFQNGEELTAEDVKFTFDRLLGGLGSGTVSALYDTLESVDIVDDLTVHFNLNTADSAFIERIGSIWGASIVPKDYLEEVGDEVFLTEPIGSGPYQVTEVSPEQITLQRNDNFWGEAPAYETVEMVYLPEAVTRVTALLTGEVDIIDDIPNDQLATLTADETISVIETSIQNLHVYVFNTMNEESIMSNQ